MNCFAFLLFYSEVAMFFYAEVAEALLLFFVIFYGVHFGYNLIADFFFRTMDIICGTPCCLQCQNYTDKYFATYLFWEYGFQSFQLVTAFPFR